MRILASFIAGFALAPCIACVMWLVAADRPPASPSHAATLGALGAVALLCGLVRVERVSLARFRCGALLLLCTSIAAVGYGEHLPGSLSAALACVLLPAAIGLAAIGGGPLQPAATALGAALGLLISEHSILPRHGSAILIPLAVLLLIAARRATPAASAPPRALGSRIVDLALVGLFAGYTSALAYPFLMQHLSGGRFSAMTLPILLLLGGGLGLAIAALFPARGGLEKLVRALLPVLAVGVFLLTFRSLHAAADATTLDPAYFSERTDALLLRRAAAYGDGRLFELAITQTLLGPLAVFSGLWFGQVSRDGRPGRSAGIVLLGAALGAALAGRGLDGGTTWPGALAGNQSALIRRGPLELLDDFLIRSHGVLRIARNPTLSDDEHLMWHGRRASRIKAFRLLEQQEVLLPIDRGGRLLLVGNATANHRLAIGNSAATEYVVAPTLPLFHNAALAGESQRDLDDAGAATERFDAISVLSAPFLTLESARVLTRSRLAALRGMLADGGSLFVWLDLRAADDELIAGLQQAMRDACGSVRTWIAMDGYVGPLLAFEGGGLPPRTATEFATPIDLGDAFDGPAACLTRPFAATRPPRPAKHLPLADPGLLQRLASAIDATGAPAAAALLRALAEHSANYFPAEAVNDPLDRHRIVDAECTQLAAAVAAGADDPLVINQVKQFTVLAAARKEYRRLDLVLQPMLKHHPDDAGLRFVSGRAAYDLLDWESTIEDLEISLRESPRNPEASLMLGLAYARLTPPDFASAISALQTGRELAPDDADIVRALGMVLADSGREAEAVQYLERAVMLRPIDWEARSRLEEIRSR